MDQAIDTLQNKTEEDLKQRVNVIIERNHREALKETLPSGPSIITPEMTLELKEDRMSMKDVLCLVTKISENDVGTNWTSHLRGLETIFQAWNIPSQCTRNFILFLSLSQALQGKAKQVAPQERRSPWLVGHPRRRSHETPEPERKLRQDLAPG